MMNQYYIGTDLKFLFNIECSGFSMDEDEYEITLVCGKQRMVVPPSQIVVDGENHYLCLDSKMLGQGLVKLVVKAHVPDDDFPDGKRTEVDVIDLCLLRATY